MRGAVEDRCDDLLNFRHPIFLLLRYQHHQRVRLLKARCDVKARAAEHALMFAEPGTSGNHRERRLLGDILQESDSKALIRLVAPHLGKVFLIGHFGNA